MVEHPDMFWGLLVSFWIGNLMLMGYILGPLMEENFRRTLLLSRGDTLVFFERPLSGTFMAVTILMLSVVAYKRLRGRAALAVA